MNILFQAFNQLSTEIIITDLDFHIITMNESAASNGWKSDSLNHSQALERVISKSKINKSELPSLDSLIDDESFENLKEALEHTQQNSSATTKRDLSIKFKNGQKRTIDLTVSLSVAFEVYILEISDVDNLNKIIDSTRTFASQKIAAGLARSLAHEVKNPLSGIKGSAQILEKKYSDDFSKKFLKIIVDETDRLNDIVNRILTPAKKPDLDFFNIHEAVERVLTLAGADNIDKIEIRKNYDPSIPEIYGDKNLFIQALLNITQNAIHAIDVDKDAFIEISTGVTFRQPINGKIFSTLATIKIADNGPGIDDTIKDQIFFPMISTKESGSGLGLSIAQDIVRMHGGTISYERKEGSTVFSVVVPIESKLLAEQVNA